MSLRGHAFLLLGGCALVALLLVAIGAFGYTTLQDIEVDRTIEAVALQDLESLDSHIGSWLTICDLVVASRVTHLAPAATVEGEALRAQIAVLLDKLPPAVNTSGLENADLLVRQILGHVAQSAGAYGGERTAILGDSLRNLDADAEELVRAIGAATAATAAQQERTSRSVEIWREALWRYGLFACLAYLLFLLAAMRWNTTTLIRPLSRLTEHAHAAMTADQPFGLREEGPREIRHLTRTVSQFVDSLEQANFDLSRANEDLEAKVQVRTRELEKANTARTEFLASVSHELRTPLNVILGMSELAAERASTTEVHEYLTHVAQSSRSLRRLIDDLLEFALLDVGRLAFTAEPVNLSQLADAAHLMLASRSTRSGVTLRFEGHQALSRPVLADPTRLTQILINLVGNALKFTAQGSVVARFDVSPGPDDKCEVRIDVTDTGVGIPDHALQKVFERFYQVDNSTHRRHGGTGLGLSITRDLVEAMGGGIFIESQVGVGTTVTVRLYLRYAGENAQPTANPISAADQSGRRALVVDDNAANRMLTRRFLELSNWEVREACDGAEALEATEKFEFDIVLMDIEMPGLDGYETARRIRQKNTRIPILALTAHALESYRLQALEAGMNDCLAKPVSRTALLQRVSQLASAS